MPNMSSGLPVTWSEDETGRQEAFAPSAAEQPPEQMRCDACSGGVLARDTARTALWDRDRLVIVEDIPALVCRSCGETYFEDETAMLLDLLRGGGLPQAQAVRQMTVPVFSFSGARAAHGGGGGDATG